MTSKPYSTDYAPPVFSPYPFFVKVIKEANGKYTVKTNTHIIRDLMIEQDVDLNYITLPYCGIDCDITLDCDDSVLHERIRANFDSNSAYHIFLQDRHPSFPNAFQNLAHVREHHESFFDGTLTYGSMKGKPVLFLGAGPSLEAHIEKVRKLREMDTVLIVAGGSANRVLCKHGILPHYGLAYDPNEVEKQVVFDHLTEEYMEAVPFITTLGLQHNCFKRIRKGYLLATTAMEKLYKMLHPDIEIVSEGKVSISNLFTRLASDMGFSDVYYLGVDLMFREGSLHQYADIDTIKNERTTDYECICNEHTKHKQVETRIAWCREAVDIVNDSQKHGYRFHQLSQRSLLSDYWDVPKEDFDQLFEYTDKATALPEMPLLYTRDSIDSSMKILLDDAEKLVEDTSKLRSIKEYVQEHKKDSPVLSKLLYSYLIVQDFREIRTNEWNSVLVRIMVERMLGYIKGYYEYNQMLLAKLGQEIENGL